MVAVVASTRVRQLRRLHRAQECHGVCGGGEGAAEGRRLVEAGSFAVVACAGFPFHGTGCRGRRVLKEEEDERKMKKKAESNNKKRHDKGGV